MSLNSYGFGYLGLLGLLEDYLGYEDLLCSILRLLSTDGSILEVSPPPLLSTSKLFLTSLSVSKYGYFSPEILDIYDIYAFSMLLLSALKLY